MPRGRPKRDKQAELAQANAMLDEWNRMPLVALMVQRAAERYWLRLRLGESEDTVDVLDGVIESGTPPLGNPLT